MAGIIRAGTAEQLESDFHSLVDNEMGSDVCFKLDDGLPVHGHKAILAARCDHFKRMFFETGVHMAEGRSCTVQVSDCPREAFVSLLKILYTGCVDAEDPCILIETHRLLKKYDMPDTASALVPSLLCKLSAGNITNCIEVAHRTGDLDLRNKLVDELCRIGDATLLQGSAVQMLSRDVLAAIAQRALDSASLGTQSFVCLQGAVKQSHRMLEDAHRQKKRRIEGDIGFLSGDATGWNSVAFTTPCVPHFFVKFAIGKGNQIGLWVVEDTSSESDVLKFEHLKVGEGIETRGPIRKGTRFELHIGDGQLPDRLCAKLLKDGHEIMKMEFSRDVKYRAVLRLGDFDGVEDLTIGTG